MRRPTTTMLGSIGLAVAGSLLAGCAWTSWPSPPRERPTPSRVLDLGRARLVLPAGWQVVIEPAPCSVRTDPPQPACEAPCAPGANDTLYVGSPAPVTSCKELLRGPHNAVWLVRRPAFGRGLRAPRGRLVPHWRGDAVLVVAPSLGADVLGFGARGVAVASHLGPSSLWTLLHLRLPTRVPSSWRSVRLGVLTAEVPASWPVVDLARRHFLNPGECGFAPFATPAADLGRSTVTAMCPLVGSVQQLQARASPGDGLWLATTSVPRPGGTTAAPYPVGCPGADQAVVRHLHGLTVELFVPADGQPTGSVDFLARSGSHEVAGILGLGRDPSVAAAVLSSLRAR